MTAYEPRNRTALQETNPNNLTAAQSSGPVLQQGSRKER